MSDFETSADPISRFSAPDDPMNCAAGAIFLTFKALKARFPFVFVMMAIPTRPRATAATARSATAATARTSNRSPRAHCVMSHSLQLCRRRHNRRHLRRHRLRRRHPPPSSALAVVSAVVSFAAIGRVVKRKLPLARSRAGTERARGSNPGRAPVSCCVRSSSLHGTAVSPAAGVEKLSIDKKTCQSCPPQAPKFLTVETIEHLAEDGISYCTSLKSTALTHRGRSSCPGRPRFFVSVERGVASRRNAKRKR